MKQRTKNGLVAMLVALLALGAVFYLAQPDEVVQPIAEVELEAEVPTNTEAVTLNKGNLQMISGVECDPANGDLVVGLKNPSDETFLLRPLTREERVYGTQEATGLKMLLNGRVVRDLPEHCGRTSDEPFNPGDEARCEFEVVPNDNRQDIVLRAGESNNVNVFNIKTPGMTQRMEFTC